MLDLYYEHCNNCYMKLNFLAHVGNSKMFKLQVRLSTKVFFNILSLNVDKKFPN